jgi:hypothetical protein
MEMGRITRENDDAARRKRFHLIAIKLIPETDVENTR